jgi:hypothetical protein
MNNDTKIVKYYICEINKLFKFYLLIIIYQPEGWAQLNLTRSIINKRRLKFLK